MFPSRIGSSSKADASSSSSGRKCQKCLQTGHASFECKNPRAYQSRPTRSQAFEDAKVQKKLRDRQQAVKVPEELLLKRHGTADAILAKRAAERATEEGATSKGKDKVQNTGRRGRSSSSSSSGSYSSDYSSDSDSDSGSGSRRKSRASRKRSRTSSSRSLSRSRSRSRSSDSGGSIDDRSDRGRIAKRKRHSSFSTTSSRSARSLSSSSRSRSRSLSSRPRRRRSRSPAHDSSA